MKEIGIYKITNIVNGKVYIGQSRNLKKRKNAHFSTLRSNAHYNKYLQRSFNKYGEDAFIFEILEYSEITDLYKRENYWIGFYESFDFNKGYNATLPSEDDKKFNHTKYTKQHLSEVRLIFTKEELLSYLHEFYYHNGKLPTNRDLANNNFPNYGTYIKHFGSVTNALIETGLTDGKYNEKFTSRKPYTKEDVIEKFNNFIYENERFPNINEMKSSFDNNLVSTNVIVNLFGSTENLKNELDYDFEKEKQLELEDALHGLKKLYEQDGYITSRTIDNSSITRSTKFYMDNFGSLVNAYVEAGLSDGIDYKKLAKKAPYIKDDVIEKFNQFIEKYNRFPNKYEQAKADENGLVSKGVILKLFGSMENFKIEIGYNYDELELKKSLKGLVEVYEKDGYVSSSNLGKSELTKSVKYYRNHFGSLINAYIEAGVYNKEVIESSYKNYIIKNGKFPSTREIGINQLPCIQIVKHFYGSLNNFKKVIIN